MRIVLDLQGAQSTSRNRGIGRYSLSLAQAIARNAGEHEVSIVLNGLFADTIEPLRAAFDALVSRENIHVWHAPGPVCEINPANNWRRRAAELSREAFLAGLRPDVVHLSSLFEGLVDDAVTSIGGMTTAIPTSVTLYDLILLIHREQYLNDARHELWYNAKLAHLRRADHWIAISDSSRREGVDYLGLPADRMVTCPGAVEAQFRAIRVSAETERDLRRQHRLSRPFVMYTGGDDRRKNVEGLIRAYARLPAELRRRHQLAVICSVRPETRRRWHRLARQQGLAAGDLVVTGFVPDEELVTLYNLCKLFVFPSWHEGFGLPALEAMSCGAPAIGAKTSSLPEVIGRADALFDPMCDAAIAGKLCEALGDEAFRNDLSRHALEYSQRFSWDFSARRAIASFEQLHASRRGSRPARPSGRRPTMAFVSPLPPARSGIADYSAELLPELARHYDIDVVVAQETIADAWIQANCQVRDTNWFAEHAHRFDRIVYQFGNSEFHWHMFDLLERFPGVVVLHDFFLSGILAFADARGWSPNGWAQELHHAHGYAAVRERFAASEARDVILKYPCNLSVLQQAKGVIVHSQYSRKLAEAWYGSGWADDWSVIPLLRAGALNLARGAARQRLGLPENAFVVCSFGAVGPTKQNRRLLDAFCASELANDGRCMLLFVGENLGGEYGDRLFSAIRASGLADRIRITGWADQARFRDYLAAADLAVQLRTSSRGETSAAVLDCMNYGLPTVANANGSMGELPEDGVCMLPDSFSDAQLSCALQDLWRDSTRRAALGARARDWVRTVHAPRSCADRYAETIEDLYHRSQDDRHALVRAIGNLPGPPADDAPWLALAQSIARSFPARRPRRRLLLDVSQWVHCGSEHDGCAALRTALTNLLLSPPDGFAVEPIHCERTGAYRHARQFSLRLLDCPNQALADEAVAAHRGDILVRLDGQPEFPVEWDQWCGHLRRIGGRVYCLTADQNLGSGDVELEKRLRAVCRSDSAESATSSAADCIPRPGRLVA